jgi:hypothetical protein
MAAMQYGAPEGGQACRFLEETFHGDNDSDTPDLLCLWIDPGRIGILGDEAKISASPWH